MSFDHSLATMYHFYLASFVLLQLVRKSDSLTARRPDSGEPPGYTAAVTTSQDPAPVITPAVDLRQRVIIRNNECGWWTNEGELI